MCLGRRETCWTVALSGTRPKPLIIMHASCRMHTRQWRSRGHTTRVRDTVMTLVMVCDGVPAVGG